MSKYNLKFTEPHLLSGYPKEETVLVALSGGADSSALLRLLCEYRKATGCRVVAAHVNHLIRGEKYGFEADRDESFCKRICAEAEVELCTERIDIPNLSRLSGKSLETEARDQRYAFFTRLMNERGIKILATAHNADDDLETKLFNFSRGCGIDGLAGIPETRVLGGVDGGIVIRPLLYARKNDIIEYCREKGIDFVTDSTNLENDCTRNTLRNKIIPELDALFPSLYSASQRIGESAAEDADFIISEAKKYLDGKNGEIDVRELSSLHRSVAKRVLMLAFANCSDATLEAVHLEALLSLSESRKNGASVSLPDKKQATVIDRVLVFGDERKDTDEKSVQYSVPLNIGLNNIENTPFSVEIYGITEEKADAERNNSPYASAVLNIDDANALCAKSRSVGDRIRDGGINKKIKKLMCDKHVPLSDRDTVPLISLGEEIIYVPLCAVSDSAKPKKQERKTLIRINIYKGSLEV